MTIHCPLCHHFFTILDSLSLFSSCSNQLILISHPCASENKQQSEPTCFLNYQIDSTYNTITGMSSMASVRYSRIDGRRPSNYCSTVTIVGFVAFSLVAVWMFMSPTIVPFQKSDVSLRENNDVSNKKSSENNFITSGDNAGETSQDATQRDGDTGSSLEENKEEVVENTKVIEKNNDKTDQVETIYEKIDGENVGSDNNKETNEISQSGIKGDPEGKYVENESEGDSEKNISEKTSDDVAANSPTGVTELERGGSETNMESSTKPADVGKGEKEVENISNEGKDNTAWHGGEENVPSGDNAEILNESSMQKGTWSTQSQESQNEKSQQDLLSKNEKKYEWKVCNTSAGPDYIPCLDNLYVVRRLPSMAHYEHRERHCPSESPTCLVPLPKGYKQPIGWPKSRGKIWFDNVPHTKLAQVKGHQNWVKVDGEYLTFPGGGTQFVHGAGHYISFIEEGHPPIAWGKRSRVILDVGCGVASFGGFLFDREVLTMSFAPKDEHEAQVQFALERGIPAILEVMGTQRLPFPGGVFDVVHCARCRVPWHVDGGKLLLELNRVLRPGGFFVWSATPVYRKDQENVGIWQAMSKLTKSMCWDLLVVKRDRLNNVAVAIYRKPTSNDCYEKRPKQEPPLCKESDDQNAAWNVLMQACMHKVPVNTSERGSIWPEQWPLRLEKPPYWLNSKVGVYGKAAPVDFSSDYEHWTNVISKSYLNGLGIRWSDVRNVMDMRAVYGGFAAALRDLPVWVMNVVPTDSPDTLPIIYDRGLFGLYHDWCESFNTYPRSYDLLHADHLFSNLKRCKLESVIAEVDRVLRPEGKLIVRDNAETIMQIESIVKSLQWEIKQAYTRNNEGLLCVQKTRWRPSTLETISSAFY